MTGDVIAIDPGLRQCGVATFADGELSWAGLIKSGVKTARGPEAWVKMYHAIRVVTDGYRLSKRVVVEFPKAYAGGKQQADPADLLELAAITGVIAAYFEPCGVTRVFPWEWKGQMDKTLCKTRVVERLSPAELLRVTKDDHNVWDAVGIGLHAVGRFERKRVFAR